MRISHVASDVTQTLQTTRYIVDECEPLTGQLAREKLRIAPVVGPFVVSAIDVYKLHEIGAAHRDEVPQEVLDEVQDLRFMALVLSGALTLKAGKQLYPFQMSGVDFLLTTRDALLFDEMGLGKTIQALMAMPEDVAGVIVCPKSLLHNWKSEGEAWRPDLQFTILDFTILDRQSIRSGRVGEMVIMTPDSVRIHHETNPISYHYEQAPVRSVVILDEAHMYKNVEAARTEAIRRLTSHYDIRWALTGTPLANTPPDLWSVLNSIGLSKKVFGTWDNFVRIFGGVRLGTGQWHWPKDSIDEPALSEAFRGRSLRRLRSVVAPEIPEKTYATIHSSAPVCSPEDKTAIARAQRAMDTTGQLNDRQLGELSRLRSELAESKIPAMCAMVDRFLETGDPLVVVSANLGPLEELARIYNAPLIIGKTLAENRAKAIDDFQSGKSPLIGIHPVAGGVGITLTAAHHMLFVQRDWSEAVNQQAEDRICRIGQRSTCVIYDIVSSHPLDTRIFAALRRKAQLMATTTGTIPSQVPDAV